MTLPAARHPGSDLSSKSANTAKHHRQLSALKAVQQGRCVGRRMWAGVPVEGGGGGREGGTLRTYCSAVSVKVRPENVKDTDGMLGMALQSTTAWLLLMRESASHATSSCASIWSKVALFSKATCQGPKPRIKIAFSHDLRFCCLYCSVTPPETFAIPSWPTLIRIIHKPR